MNRKHWLRFCVLSVGLMLGFQNCGRVNMAPNLNTADLNSLATPYVNISQVTLMTSVNEAVDMAVSNAVTGTVVSLDQNTVLTEQDISNAHVSLNMTTQKLTVTPAHGFRGTTSFTIYSTFKNIINIQNVTVLVQNPTLNINPALAVRGPECLVCHASIAGDMVSDFGYKSATETGPDVFATGRTGWLSIYGVAHSGSDSLNSASIVGNLIIPKMNFASLDPSVPRLMFPATPTAATPTLASYITTFQNPTNVGYKGISEYSDVHIGAPLASEIIAGGLLSATQPMVYYKNASDSADLAGFTHFKSGTFDYYGNTAGTTLFCEGDLLIDGVVFLDHLSIQTIAGCRIYATHTVFVSGPITYVNQRALSNIEITSAAGIYMGFGYCVNCADSNVNGTNYGYQNQNTVTARWGVIMDDGAITTFRNGTPEAHIAATLADFAKVSNTPTSLPPAPAAGVNATTYYKNYFASQNVRLLDGTNLFVAEDATTYQRLMLNAPVVMSRYNGDFEGTVIAEFAMWRLGSFQFTFDSVFTGVPLFPFLKLSTILSVTK